MDYLDRDSSYPSLSHTATYDSLNGLGSSTATGSITHNLTFTYPDRYGNMTCETNGSTNGPCANWTFNAATNQISASGFAHDAAGNLTTDASFSPVHTYQWDAEGRMKSVDSGAKATNTYNALGWLAEKLVPGYHAEYVIDPSGVSLGQYSGLGGSWDVRLVPFGNRVITNEGPLQTLFPHANAVLSTTVVTNYSGTILQDQLFYPWGQQWTNAQSQYELHFGALSITDLGNYFAPFRLYSTSNGRWLTPDPAGLKAVHLNDPQTWNMYAYVRNNPTTLTDPSGLDVYLANDTEEGRKRAWARLARNLTEKEASNIAYRQNKEGKYELFVKDSSAVNLSKASPGYKDLIGLINDRSIMANYGLVGGGLSATFASLGTVTSYGAGGLTTQPEGKSVDVLVQQGNLPGGVKVFAPSGGETTGIQPDYLTAAHELFGETLKYRAGHESLQNDPLQDSRTVIGIENDIRRFLGFPLRTGSDHGIPVIVVEP